MYPKAGGSKTWRKDNNDNNENFDNKCSFFNKRSR